MEPKSDQTVTDMLREQHERVKSMLNDLIELPQGSARNDLFDRLRATLAVHETAEEIVVHPAVHRTGDAGAQAVDARLEEEGEAKTALAELEKLTPEGDGFDAKLRAFQKNVLAHAEAEEREVFPLLEQHYDRDEQKKMAAHVAIAEDMAPTHPHPHGPESGLGNLLVGPFVAMIDKVRDKLAS